MRWMADTVADVAPHIPVRDLETLRRHFPGLDGDALAERLIRNAARATAGDRRGRRRRRRRRVGRHADPALRAGAAGRRDRGRGRGRDQADRRAARGLRRPVPGSGSQRAVALLQAWAGQRGVNPLVPGVGVAAVLGTAARKELRDRLLRRFGRNLTTLGPAAHRRGGGRLPQPAGDPGARRADPQGPAAARRPPGLPASTDRARLGAGCRHSAASRAATARRPARPGAGC